MKKLFYYLWVLLVLKSIHPTIEKSNSLYTNAATFFTTRVLASVVHESAHYLVAQLLNARPYIAYKPLVYGSTRFRLPDTALLRIMLVHIAGPLAEGAFSYGILKYSHKTKDVGRKGIEIGAWSGIATSLAHLLPCTLPGQIQTDGSAIKEAVKMYQKKP